MKSENWNPGHSVNKGWPYDGVKTFEAFPKRLTVWQDPKTLEVGVDVNEKVWGKVETTEKCTPFESFLMLRLYDYAFALKMAEEQIVEILSETPFNPEDLGFELVMRHQEGEAPMRIYVSKFNPDFSIFRKPGDPTSKDWKPTLWTVIKGNMVDGHKVFQEIDVLLPCARIAYALFAALGLQMSEEVPVEPEKDEQSVTGFAVDTCKMMADIKSKPGKKFYKLNFKRGDIDQDFDVEVDRDCNERDATSKLLFLLQTGATNLGTIEGADWEDISVIPSQQSKRQHKSSATEPPSEAHTPPAK